MTTSRRTPHGQYQLTKFKPLQTVEDLDEIPFCMLVLVLLTIMLWSKYVANHSFIHNPNNKITTTQKQQQQQQTQLVTEIKGQ